MSLTTAKPSSVWNKVQLLLGFHRAPDGSRRATPKVWPPKDSRASIHADPEEQETFAVVEAAKGADGRDVQVKFRRDMIVLTREPGPAWEGLVISDDTVRIRARDRWIKIGPDGSVRVDHDQVATFVEPDGAVIKTGPTATSVMSPDGAEVSRRNPDGFCAIGPHGVVARPTLS
ncbi:hypothetical protein EU803_15010 [Loktanella sp. IMCC34160]|uniref:hypothetical protein n=1 Tax=Loktanella sp. IMCC34160 TaxID=2510646 RepID=UPI00101B7F08|nr:hypothetical protein [Loktanella sp. IMCC34160]RYG89931.1 hypothetical protein EU803_15010 [Loktanella sp. IMCC34160]